LTQVPGDMEKDIRVGVKTTVYAHGMRCSACGTQDANEFSQTQVKKLLDGKPGEEDGWKPTCKKCARFEEEKRKWTGDLPCVVCEKKLVAADFSKNQLANKRQDETYRMTCLSCSRVSQSNTEEAPSTEGGERTQVITFKPGKLGLGIEGTSVNKLTPDSQAASLGVGVGWVIHAINEVAVDQKSTKQAVLDVVSAESKASTVDVSFTFRVPLTASDHCCAQCNQFLNSSLFARGQLMNKGAGKQRCHKCVAEAQEVEAREQLHNRTANLSDARLASKKAEAIGTVGQKLVTSAREAALEAELVTGLKPMVLGKGRGKR